MKKTNNFLSRILLFMAVMFVFLSTAGTKADAASTKTIKKNIILTGDSQIDIFSISYGNLYDGTIDKYSKVTVKSSNKKVITAKDEYNYPYKMITMKPKKTGKASVTVKYYQKGKKSPVKTEIYKFTIKKYTNPFKTFKIGNTSVAGKFSKYRSSSRDGYELELPDEDIDGKVSISLKSGWKFVSSDFPGKTVKSLKKVNGKRIRDDVVSIILKKGDTTIDFMISF